MRCRLRSRPTEPCGAAGSATTILAQRAAGPFRAAICRGPVAAGSGREPELVISLERFDIETLCFEPVCTLSPHECGKAVQAIAALKDAVPEAARLLKLSKFLGADIVDDDVVNGGPT